MEDEEGTKIGMSLPEELTVGKGIVTENGIVVYQTDKDVDVCIQSITGQQDGIPLEGAREILTSRTLSFVVGVLLTFLLIDRVFDSR